MICVIQHEFDEFNFNVLNSQELLCISDMAAACYCGCKDQLEPEQIELLAAMTAEYSRRRMCSLPMPYPVTVRSVSRSS